MKKIGIITFHNSYNCGSMLESYAIEEIVKGIGRNVEIINFSNESQRRLYSVFNRNDSLKNMVKNLLLIPAKRRIDHNNQLYEKFKNDNFNLSMEYSTMGQLNDRDYYAVIAGSDQIWNITIDDSDDAYFLPWVHTSKKIAYAPSFGAKDIMKYSVNIDKYRKMINDFDALSVREFNGKKWIKKLCNKDVEVLLDPTLLLNKEDYEKIEDNNIQFNQKYIFFYSPSFDRKICRFVKLISQKYGLKVITWSTKSYYIKFVKAFGFELVKEESPSIYLSLIKNAELVITTSYHGTIFSIIYKKKYIVAKNGGMYGDDDRVISLLEQLDMKERLVQPDFDKKINYLEPVNFTKCDQRLEKLKEKSIQFLKESIENR